MAGRCPRVQQRRPLAKPADLAVFPNNGQPLIEIENFLCTGAEASPRLAVARQDLRFRGADRRWFDSPFRFRGVMIRFASEGTLVAGSIGGGATADGTLAVETEAGWGG